MSFLELVRTVSPQFLQKRSWFCLEIEIVSHSSFDSFSDLMLSSVTFVVHGPFGGLIHSQPIRDVTLTLSPS